MGNLLKIVLVSVVAGAAAARASTLDAIGVTLLRATTTNLNGAGVLVGQAEAGYESATNWQVNPGSVAQPANRFTYFYGTPPYALVSSANTYPNSLGGPSGHANTVAGNYYGLSGGVATNVAHVDNYEANTFINYYINDGHSISERIVNQSFTYGTNDAGVDQIYDDYAAQHNVLFVTGAGFGGQPVYTPATCYNGIGVGSDAFNSPNGPTPDGRSKPDIIAPGFSETSYTTPQVAGAAVILLQAALRGDGGGDTNSAADMRTIKSLLLNGAVKPADWTNSSSAPLHPRYGAGILNVFNSYEQLAGGKNNFIVTTSVSTNSPHPPTADVGTMAVLSGWDFNSISSASGGFFSSAADGVNHYYFNITNGVNNTAFTATATLVWNRQQSQTAINNIDLFLYNCASSNLVACSTSLVDNVEHIFLPQLAPGRYDLQVWKAGGSFVSASEAYALAFEFFSQSLNVTQSGTDVVLNWPVYPDGFVVEATTNLISPAIWSTNNPVPFVMNNQNVILLNATNANQFFRLRRP